jgi:hypothetical protein
MGHSSGRGAGQGIGLVQKRVDLPPDGLDRAPVGAEWISRRQTGKVNDDAA